MRCCVCVCVWVVVVCALDEKEGREPRRRSIHGMSVALVAFEGGGARPHVRSLGDAHNTLPPQSTRCDADWVERAWDVLVVSKKGFSRGEEDGAR